MLTIRAMSDGKGYSARHLEHNDYYAEGECVTGQWQGRGAELLGLRGEVKAEEFESVRQGMDPTMHEFLRLRHSADRLSADGTTLAQGRSLYDFTISAPKSVSVMATVGEDERLIAAHQTAAAETLREMEQHAASRVRQDGAAIGDNRPGLGEQDRPLRRNVCAHQHIAGLEPVDVVGVGDHARRARVGAMGGGRTA